MELNKEDLLQIAEMVGNDVQDFMKQAEELRPLIQFLIGLIKSFSKEIADIPDAMLQWARDQRVKSIRYYMSQGFEKDDAILMTLADSDGIQRIGDRMNKGRK